MSDQNLGIEPETFYFPEGSEAQSKPMQLKQKLFIQEMQDPLLMYVSMFISAQQLKTGHPHNAFGIIVRKHSLTFPYLENTTEALSLYQYKHYMDIKTAYARVILNTLDLQ